MLMTRTVTIKMMPTMMMPTTKKMIKMLMTTPVTINLIPSMIMATTP